MRAIRVRYLFFLVVLELVFEEVLGAAFGADGAAFGADGAALGDSIAFDGAAGVAFSASSAFFLFAASTAASAASLFFFMTSSSEAFGTRAFPGGRGVVDPGGNARGVPGVCFPAPNAPVPRSFWVLSSLNCFCVSVGFVREGFAAVPGVGVMVVPGTTFSLVLGFWLPKLPFNVVVLGFAS